LVAELHGNSKRRLPIDAEMAWSQTVAINMWSKKPGADILGVDDGVAHRMDRLEALGNGQVPAVAKFAWEIC
jgi:DNA (cytosine-5)-methyltransferase 1